MQFRHHCPIQPDFTAESRNWSGIPLRFEGSPIFLGRDRYAGPQSPVRRDGLSGRPTRRALDPGRAEVLAGLMQTRRKSRPTAAGELLGAFRDDLPTGSSCRHGPDPGGYREVGTNF